MNFKRIVLPALFAAGTLCFADESLLFKADFDAWTVTADHAKGKKESTTFKNPSLQLRMWPGINGKGNALALEKSERCGYSMKNNFNPKQGTVSFWVAPLNWKPSQPGFQWFFSASQNDFVLHIYKYTWANCLYFYIQSNKFPGNKKTAVAHAFIDDKDWGTGVWHKIDAVWDRTGMKLYIDGAIPRKVKWLTPVLNFSAPVDFPAAAANGRIALNDQPSQGKDKYQRTAFDNLRIYDRPLSAKEIHEEYTKYKASKFGAKREVPILPVPKEKNPVVIDGKINASEWSDASIAPITEIALFSRNKSARIRGKAYLKHDGTKLKIAISANYLPTLKKYTRNDDKLWEDDGMELHFYMPDKSVIQFIINGNGAVFDMKNNRREWNGGIKPIISFSSNGWSMETEIPFSALGGKPEKANFYLSQYKGKELSAVGWSLAGGAFVAPKIYGKLVYTNVRFGVEETGSIENGDLALKLRSSGSIPSAEVETETGIVIKADSNFPKAVWKASLPSGKQKIIVKAERGGKVVGFYEHYYYVDSPVEIKYDNKPYQKKTVVTVNLSGTGAETLSKIRKYGMEGTISYVRKSDGKIMASTKVTAKKTVETFDIPLPELAMDEYYIVAQFGDATNKIRFNVPDMRPFGAVKPGVDHSVPKPWTPVIVNGKKFGVLDRTYTFGNTPFPQSVISRGSEMLSAAPVLTVDGKQPVWSDFKIVKAYPDRVLFSGKGNADGWIINWNGELWFDGFYQLKFNTSGKRKISEMTLTYSVPREFARYVFKQDYRYSLFSWNGNRIEKEFNPLKYRMNTLQWTSGVEKGFAFAPESNKNWANKPNEKNIILVRDARNVKVTAKIISRPVEVKTALDYTFVFQGTPSRRPHPDTRDMNCGGYDEPTMRNIQFGSGGDHAFYDQNFRDQIWTTPASMKPRFPDRYAKYVKRMKDPATPKAKAKNNSRLKGWFGLNYCMPMHIGTNEAEYDYFINEWITLPTCVWNYKAFGVPSTIFSTCGNTGATDVLIWNLDKLLRDGHLPGIYNDCAHTPACENARHGHGGIDAFGQRFSTSSMLSQREYFLRSYRVIQKYGKFLFNHVPSGDIIPFVHCFSDLVWPGEEFHQQILDYTDHCYIEFIPKEAWQSVFSSRIRGVSISLLPQYGRAAGAMPAEKRKKGNFAKDPEWAMRTMTPCLVHDVLVSAESICRKTVDKWWIIKEPLLLNKAKFHGYWFDDTVRSSTRNVLVSWYELPKEAQYRYLIIAANYNRGEAPVGIEKIPFKYSTIRELWTGRDVTADDLKNMKFPGNHFRLFGIK